MAEIIAEVGNVHEGSLGIAMSIVEMLAKQGVKIVKFQMHIAEQEGVNDEPFRVNFSPQDESRQDYWKRVNFSIENWIKLANFCKDMGVEFLCTPFSKRAAEILYENRLIRRWKVGSGDATNLELLEFLISTGLPIILSTGLVSSKEIDELVSFFREKKAIDKLILLHCVSKYPASLDAVDLHLMHDLRKYGCPFGFSDHTGSLSASIYALALGAQIIEVHTTPHKEFFGPDVTSSLLPEQIGFLIAIAEDFDVLVNSNASKDDHFASVQSLRKLFRKGLYWKSSLQKGHMVRFEDFLFLKPVIGIDGFSAYALVGSTLLRDVDERSPVLDVQLEKKF